MKDEEIKFLKDKNYTLVSGNKTLRKELKDLAKELDRSKLESVQSKHHDKSKFEILETRLEDQRSEAEASIRNIENKKADWKVYRDRFMIQSKELRTYSIPCLMKSRKNRIIFIFLPL